MARPPRPTKDELAAAAGRHIPDILAPDLRVVFCGINPSLYSAAVGHHFARPGNRFWPALHRSGFTDRLLTPEEDRSLLEFGAGLTNLVERATRAASDLTSDEIARGADALTSKVRQYKPAAVAFLGIDAYRTAFAIGARAKVTVGEQDARLESARVFVLPNPSGLNAHYQLDDFAGLFRALDETLPRKA